MVNEEEAVMLKLPCFCHAELVEAFFLFVSREPFDTLRVTLLFSIPPTFSSVYQIFSHKNTGLCNGVRGDRSVIFSLLHSVPLRIFLMLLSKNTVSNHSFVSVEILSAMRQNIFYLRYIHRGRRVILYLWNDKAWYIFRAVLNTEHWAGLFYLRDWVVVAIKQDTHQKKNRDRVVLC